MTLEPTKAQLKYAKYLDRNVKYFKHKDYFRLDTAPRDVVEQFIASAKDLPTRKQVAYAEQIATSMQMSIEEIKHMSRAEIEKYIDEYGTKLRMRHAHFGNAYYRNVDIGHDIGIDFHDLC